jgi:hypothetical protein
VALPIGWASYTIGLPRNPAEEIAPLATRIALPQQKVPDDALEPKDRLALQRDAVQFESDSRLKAWTLLAQSIGAAVLPVGGYFTWRSLRVAYDVQITNRYTDAIAHLDASKALEVRVGGIFSLERIARTRIGTASQSWKRSPPTYERTRRGVKMPALVTYPSRRLTSPLC